MLQVTDSSGDVVATRNVGAGYTPDSAVEIAEGVAVRLSGSVNGGVSLATEVVSRPDTAGILTALGLNTFFVGGDANSIAVNPDLLGNPDRLATSRSGDVGDSSKVLRLAALRDAPLLSGGKQTFQEYFTEMVTGVGSQVQDLTENQQTQQILGERLQAERQSISGVDPNEELTRLLQFQRMFQMAAEQIKVVNQAFDALFEILR
jgi:flagellar hook-associated protein 1 FlgK